MTDPKQQTGQAFSGASNPRLTDQLKALIGKVDYLCLADKHTVNDAHKIFTNPDIMQALSEGGVKKIHLEMINLDEELIIQAAADGKIPHEAIQAYFDHQPPFVLFVNNPTVMHGYAIEAILPDIAKQAKEHEIAIVSVDHQEGMMNKEGRQQIHDMQTKYAAFVIKKIGDTPNFKELNHWGRTAFFKEAGAEFKKENPEVDATLEKLWQESQEADILETEEIGLRVLKELGLKEGVKRSPEDYQRIRKELVEKFHASLPSENIETFNRMFQNMNDQNAANFLANQYIRVLAFNHMLEERLTLDPDVAKRIQAGHVDGEKEIIVYGHNHFSRLQGDLDAALGDEKTAVLQISNAFSEKPDRKPTMNLDGAESYRAVGVFDEKPDYTLDLSTGAWTDTKTEKTTTVEIPESLKPKVTEAAPTPQPDSKPTTQPEPSGG